MKKTFFNIFLLILGLIGILILIYFSLSKIYQPVKTSDISSEVDIIDIDIADYDVDLGQDCSKNPLFEDYPVQSLKTQEPFVREILIEEVDRAVRSLGKGFILNQDKINSSFEQLVLLKKEEILESINKEIKDGPNFANKYRVSVFSGMFQDEYAPFSLFFIVNLTSGHIIHSFSGGMYDKIFDVKIDSNLFVLKHDIPGDIIISRYFYLKDGKMNYLCDQDVYDEFLSGVMEIPNEKYLAKVDYGFNMWESMSLTTDNYLVSNIIINEGRLFKNNSQFLGKILSLFSYTGFPTNNFWYSADDWGSIIYGGLGAIYDVEINGNLYAIKGGDIFAFNPDKSQIAILSYDEDINKFYVTLNDKRAKSYDFVQSIHFFDNNLFYIAKENGKYFTVVNDIEGAKYDLIKTGSFIYTDNHFSFIAFNNKKTIIIIDGKETKIFNKPLYESKSHLYFVENQKGKLFVHTFATLDTLYNISKAFLIINGKSGKLYDSEVYPQHYEMIWPIIVSPKGDKIAYFAKSDGVSKIIINNKEVKEFGLTEDNNFLTEIDFQKFKWSPDNKFSYIEEKCGLNGCGGENPTYYSHLFINNQLFSSKNIFNYWWSPNGKLAFLEGDSDAWYKPKNLFFNNELMKAVLYFNSEYCTKSREPLFTIDEDMLYCYEEKERSGAKYLVLNDKDLFTDKNLFVFEIGNCFLSVDQRYWGCVGQEKLTYVPVDPIYKGTIFIGYKEKIIYEYQIDGNSQCTNNIKINCVEEINDLTIGPDAKLIIWTQDAKGENGETNRNIFVNGNELVSYKEVERSVSLIAFLFNEQKFIFSQSGKNFAYLLIEKDKIEEASDQSNQSSFKTFVVTNGKKGQALDALLSIPQFSKDGELIGYLALIEDQIWWIVDKVSW